MRGAGRALGKEVRPGFQYGSVLLPAPQLTVLQLPLPHPALGTPKKAIHPREFAFCTLSLTWVLEGTPAPWAPQPHRCSGSGLTATERELETH